MLRRTFQAGLVLLPLTCSSAFASEQGIDEITVTATRRPASVRDVAVDLTVVEGESIRIEKLVTDALAETVGVFLQQTTPGQGSPVIRGLKGSAVLHLVDGLRLNNAIYRNAPTQYFALVPVTAIERVEVIRGTPTSLYGNDAVGGVVQAVTRVPRFDSESSETSGELFASFDTAELKKNVHAIMDGGTATRAYTASAEYLSTGDRRIGGGGRTGPSGYDAWAVRTALALTPADDRRWLFDLQFVEQPDTPRVDELVPGFGQDEPASSKFAFKPNRRLFAHVGHQREDAWLAMDWRFDFAWQRIDDDRLSRDYQAPDRRREHNSSDLVGGLVSATKAGEKGAWLVGAEYYDDRIGSSRSEEAIASGDVVAVPARFPDGSGMRQVAVFANGDRRVAARHRLSGGLRFSRIDVDLAATAASPSAKLSVSDASGDIGWIYDLRADLQLVANAGSGFRAPNVFDLGTLGERPGNRYNIPNPDLASEKVRQFDLGLRYGSDRLHIDVTIYTLRYEDRISSVSTGDLTPEGREIVQSRNIAASTIRGAEAGGELLFGDSLSARMVLNYTWGEDTFAGSDSEPADRIPPLSGRLALNYARDSLALDGWVNFASRQDRLSSRDIGDPRIDPDGTAGWGTVGVRAGWTGYDGWTIALTLDNLFDQRYRRHGSGLDAAGRNAILSLRRSW